MSSNGVNVGCELYKIIVKKQFEDFSKYYMAEITYEEFSCKVDIAYRIKHNSFPLMDEKMSHNLPVVVVEVGRKLMQEFDDYLAEEDDDDFTAYQQNIDLYPKIMNACYEQFIHNYDAELTYKEYCCKVDVKYRIDHGCFPNDDEYKMAARLMNCAIELGKEMISEFDNSIDEMMYDDMIEAAADILWDAINDFLNSPFHKFISAEHGYHTSRRFPKKLIYDEEVSALLNHFSPDDTDQIAEEAFKWLKKKKYLKVVETGHKPKYDICELADV